MKVLSLINADMVGPRTVMYITWHTSLSNLFIGWCARITLYVTVLVLGSTVVLMCCHATTRCTVYQESYRSGFVCALSSYVVPQKVDKRCC